MLSGRPPRAPRAGPARPPRAGRGPSRPGRPAPVEVLGVHAVPEVVLAELETRGAVAVRTQVQLHDGGWAVRRRVPRHAQLFERVVAADATAGPVHAVIWLALAAQHRSLTEERRRARRA